VKKVIVTILLSMAVLIWLMLYIGRPSSISSIEGSTKSQLAGIANAIRIYEIEYSERPAFNNSIELAKLSTNLQKNRNPWA